MNIRQARPEDAPAIAGIWNRVIRDTAATFTDLEKTTEGLTADIETRGAGFQVVEHQGTVVGFATYFAFRGGPGYRHTKEHTIVLADAARGLGAGRALMQVLEDAARGEGVHSLFAGVSGENPAGVAFHAAIGFREVARLPEVGRKFGRWMDLILMQKML